MEVYPNADIERAAAGAGAAGCDDAAPRALVVAVEPQSPADDAGFAPGCWVTSVDGHPVRDLIDWRWLSADDVIRLGYIDLDGESGEIDLEREPWEDWGFTFEGVVFDGVRQCRNACTFCFMRQLPRGMRPSLTLRDDDFRLSFLSGTFVTLTNLSAAEEQRILDQVISPLRVSLHATDADVRRRIIGKHAAHGLEALDRLLAAGIEFHAQVVLMPGVNDGAVLAETLAWAYERPGILDVCIVPLGYTKHQTAFDRSFNDAASARAVLDQLEPVQRRARAERGTPWAFAADEFYLSAYGSRMLGHLPPAAFYGDFSMYEDGVGIVRAYVDDWEASVPLQAACARALRRENARVRLLQGFAMKPVWDALLPESPLAGVVEPLFVPNDYFGGNVDVTGLLCGCDMAAAVRREAAARAGDGGATTLFAVPRVVFNDDGVTLDGMDLEEMQRDAGASMAVVSCNPSEFLLEFSSGAQAWDRRHA
ncbi:DUF512 domain-containing protein [Xiamenia xianingshaonis]|uniref:DUF512 domain-containing protein n=1 Tax=Xiamenia xianingshaonis TaxID=2682776 RepID=A0A9E6MRX3_9ACTN|nr:DUF512 domain-containing protein [Xiamenia xianingshaonis]NHM14391.1 DUF512 domain-containing protein [Xiamenia xianingshaonis]QTU84867.1 DUF512 domain-containing protein [Xiamenia xianingshaonis]